MLNAMPRWARAAPIMLVVTGCKGVLDPKGPVGAGEKLVLFDSLAIMLVIIVPTIIATVAVAWWFRAGNTRSTYRPDWAFSGKLELIVWSIPVLVITFLGGIAWFGSHTLDPFVPLAAKQKPVEIQVVSLDWKWLFIYPEDHIATVNQLVIPAGRPVHFSLTSSGVMNSFFVPQLGSQIYTMASMTSQLNLQADRPGIFDGLSTHFSGAGFAAMNFKVSAVPQDAYAAWLAKARTGGPALDRGNYLRLAKPSQNVVPSIYSSIDPGLFAAIVDDQLIPPIKDTTGKPVAEGGNK